MDEQWDIHSGKRPSIRQFMDFAKREYDAAMQSLEPDPNADPLTYLDQQWAKESIKYTGFQRSDFGVAKRQSLGSAVGFLIGSTVIGILLLGVAYQTKQSDVYCIAGFFLICFALPMTFAVRNLWRFEQAKKAYLQRRANLINQLGLKPQLVPPAPVIDSPIDYKTQSTSPAAQIRRLGNYYYSIADRDNYLRSIQSIIAQAPIEDRDYLKALADIEIEWVQAQLKYVQIIDSDGHHYKRLPRTSSPWIGVVISAVTAIIGLLILFQMGHWIGLVIALGIPLLVMFAVITLNRQGQEYQALEEFYTEKRRQLNQRFQNRSAF